MAVTAQQLWEAIKRVESGGNYKAHSKTSSASGVGQWIRATWNNYGGYAEAWMAPPEVQEARGLHDITNKIHAYGGDISKAIMSWFLPAAVANPALANRVPKGNGISPNQYVAKVMKALGVKMPAAVKALDGTPGNVVDGATSNVVEPSRPDVNGTIEQQLAHLMAAISVPPSVDTGMF